MSLDELLNALGDHPGAILAWAADEPYDPILSLFQVDGRVTQLAYLLVRIDERPAVAATLQAHGVVPGAYARGTGLVWRADGPTLSVWGPSGRIFHTDGAMMELEADTLPFQPSMRVVAYLDADLVERGVRLEGGDAPVSVARHSQLRALMVDPSYGPLDALSDCGWTVFLGRALADVLGVSLVDQTG